MKRELSKAYEIVIPWCDIMRTPKEYPYEVEGKGLIQIANSTNVPIVVDLGPDGLAIVKPNQAVLQDYKSKEKLYLSFFLNSIKKDKLAVYGKVYFVVNKFQKKQTK